MLLERGKILLITHSLFTIHHSLLYLFMHVEYLIIGQGISGTWLSYYLQKEGKSFIVIDNNEKNSPSRIAAGIINPVTGRRHVTVWMAEQILPFAWKAYENIGKYLNLTTISQKPIIDFFPSPQMRESFVQRTEEMANYVSQPADETSFRDHFNYEFGYGKISPVYQVNPETLLPAWRNQLEKDDLLLEENFEPALLLQIPGGIQYKEIRADKIIFCDGNGSVTSSWFERLPFAPNKGEILLAEIPDLPSTTIYKRGMMLAPMSVEGLWWFGSNYLWDFEDATPTSEFRLKTEQLLKDWLKIPFTITEHLSGIRPATLERRPFVGIHPHHPAIGILNGMGTKGCSLAPFFAHQLVRHLVSGEPISPEADIKRFTRILAEK